MPTDLSLFSAFISHTPRFVWVVLALITLIGVRQMREQVLTQRRLLLAPLALAAWSLWSALHTFGPRAEVFAAWALGSALVVTLGLRSRRPPLASPVGDGRFGVEGSVWPLLTLWAVFALRYACAVALLVHPAWATDHAFGLLAPMLFGALSGWFLARALRIWHSAPSASLPQMA